MVAVEQRDVPVYREWVGTLQANVNATISAQVSGYLLSRNYVEGGAVTNGQVLFQIDDRTYKAVLDQALAKLGKSEQDVKRYTPLAKTQAISEQELDDAIQANLANEAAVESARLNYDFCKILSPADGWAGLAQAQVGDLVGPGSGALTTVANGGSDPGVFLRVAAVADSGSWKSGWPKARRLIRRIMKVRRWELTLASGARFIH